MASANYSNVSSTSHGTSNQRISDIQNEPGTMLSPIEGYEDNPLVPLEISVEPLENLVPNIARNAWIAKVRTAENPSNDLTQEESAAIHLYTMEWKPSDKSLYVHLNTALRAEDRDHLVPYFMYLKLVLSALWKLPSVSTTVWRGVKADLSRQYPVGKTFVCSCTSSLTLLESDKFLGKTSVRTLFNIQCESGKEIHFHSYFKDESEVLLLPATQFQVLGKVNPAPDLHIIQLKEIKPRFPLLQPPFTLTSSPTKSIAMHVFHKTDKTQLSTTPPITKPPKSSQPITTSLQKLWIDQTKSYRNEKLEEHIRQKATLAYGEFCERQLNDEDMRLLAEELARNTCWTTLRLSDNVIGNVGAGYVAQALKTNKTLSNLYLNNNKISDVGATELANMLKVNTKLRDLKLEDNEIGDSGMVSLTAALRHNTTLGYLMLHRNKITDKSVETIVELLTQNKTLVIINLADNSFSTRVKTTIQQVAEHSNAKVDL